MTISLIGTGLATTTEVITSSAAQAFAVGLGGGVNPAFQVDASTATSATGILVKSAAAAGGAALSVISSGAAENLTIDAKGTGTITLNATGTGAVRVGTALLQFGALGAMGYATGAGGAVTQITSSATGVTLSKPCGVITTVALTTAAGAEERFTVTNTLVAATDTIVLGSTYNGAGTLMAGVQNQTAGTFDIVLTNLHAANAFNAVAVINFAIIKAVAS